MTSGPLSGLTVVEVGRFISAPFATMLLADLGAEVVKIEPVLGGDPFRQVGDDGMPARFLAYNRNKGSIGVDLRSAEGTEVALRIISTADVLVENFRPGVMASFGLGYEEVSRDNPALVYCAISGAGPTGPLAAAPMYDAIGQGLSGLMTQLSTAGDPQPAGPTMSDSITGMTAALAIQAALIERARTGRGTHVQTSLLEATVSFLAEPAAHYFRTGEEQDWLTRPRQSQSFGFTDVDGRALVIHMSSPEKFWERLVQVVDRPGLREDPRFSNYQLRVANYLDLKKELQVVFATRTRTEWLARLEAADVPAAPVLTTRETFEHEQVRELGLERTLEGPGGYRVAGPGATVGAWRPPMTQPPALGVDTERLLTALGYSTGEIGRLRDKGVVG
jgi:formyl-CoA transferase